MNQSITLNWKGYYNYTEENVHKYTPTNGGVYKIAFPQKNSDKLTVRYVGQASNLDRRLKDHLDLDNEKNECLANRLHKYTSKFSFAEISGASTRDGAEKALYEYYEPICNDSDAIPNGPNIGINPR